MRENMKKKGKRERLWKINCSSCPSSTAMLHNLAVISSVTRHSQKKTPSITDIYELFVRTSIM